MPDLRLARGVVPELRLDPRLGVVQEVDDADMLLATFGVFQTLACAMDVVLVFEYASTQQYALTGYVLTCSFEIASMMLLWVVFFPPAWYQSWLGGAQLSTDDALLARP